MRASIILALCALASLPSCAKATYTHDASSANDSASSWTSTTVSSSATFLSSSTSTTVKPLGPSLALAYNTTVTSTSTQTMSSTQYTTTGALPTASLASSATSTSWSEVPTVQITASSTSTSMFVNTTESTMADIMLSTQNLTFTGDYATVVGSNKKRFLEECTAALGEVTCIDVHAGSVIVTLQGLPSALTSAMVQLQASGLHLPSFSSLALGMTETVSTTNIKTATETPSHSDAPANDGFILPVVIAAASLGGLCLIVACCYGILAFRRRRRKQLQEVARALDDNQILDCVILRVEEPSQESSRELNKAPNGEMPCQNFASVKLDVEEKTQETPPESTKMPSAKAPGQGLASAASNAIELDEWKLDLPCDTPEVFHEIRRGRASL